MLASGEGGERVVAEFERLALECDGQTDAQGFTTSIETAEPPAVGAGGVAFRGLATDDRGGSVTFLVSSTAIGGTALLVMHGVSFGELDPTLVEDVLGIWAARAG